MREFHVIRSEKGKIYHEAKFIDRSTSLGAQVFNRYFIEATATDIDMLL